MANDFESRRVSWVALALSLMAAGVGHVYCGRITKALPIYFAWLLVPVCGMVAATSRPSFMGLTLLLLPSLAVLVIYIYAAVDSWRLARRIGTDFTVREFNRASVYSLLIVVQLIFSFGLIAGARRFIYEAYLIPVDSMSPNIVSGDRILARKLLPSDLFPARGDLVVFRNPTPDGAARFMGRVIAVSGDRIELHGESLVVNGKELERDRVPEESMHRNGSHERGLVAVEENAGRRYSVTYGDSVDGAIKREPFQTTVPDRHVFVLGDNRDRSRDSRHFGPIHSGDIVGYVDYIFWPAQSWSRFGLADGPTR